MPNPGTRWRVQVLGDLVARSGDEERSKWPTRQVGALLALLALQPDRAQPRERLAGALWPDAEPSASRNSFRQALSTLKQMLEPPGVAKDSVLVADRQQVRLQPGAVWCDAVEFERLARLGQADAARALYAGELLPGYYDDWVLERREALADLFNGLGPQTAAALRRPVLRLLHRPGDRFVGRESEVAALLQALPRERLVSITGFGGSGKTRLAQEVAAAIGGFDLVAFVALGDCLTVQHAVARLRSTLELPPPLPGQRAMAPVRRRLDGVRALLVLDNLEQLLADGDAQLPAQLLRDLPQAHLLLTSRTATRLPQEHELALQPLPLPSQGAGLAALADNPAVLLFVERARLSRADFHLHPGNAEALRRIARALCGLPLAIDMAAALVHRMPIHDLVQAVERQPAALARQGRAASRHPQRVSLKAVLDASLRLLRPRERQLLRALASLRGGFTAAQAAAVGGVADARPALDVLLRHSLLQRDAALRHTMLPVVRELLAAPAVRRAAAEGRLRAHFVAAAQALDARHDVAALADLPNLQHAFGLGLPDAALLQVTVRTLVLAGRRDDALACCAQGRQAGGALALEADLADAWVRWRCDQQAEPLLAPVRALVARARAGAPAATRMRALRLLSALTLLHLRDPAGAWALLDEAEAASRDAGDTTGVLIAQTDRASWFVTQSRHVEAVALAEPLLERARQGGLLEVQLLLLNRLALAHEGLRHFAASLQANQALTAIAREHGLQYHACMALWNQVRPLLRLRRAEAAARLLAFSWQWWERSYGALTPDDLRYVERQQRLGRLLLGAARWDACLAEGRLMTSAVALELGSG